MTTDISDMRLLVNPSTGVLISNLDNDSIASGLHSLCDLKRKIGCSEAVEAFECVREELSIDRMFHDFNRIIRSSL